MIITKDNERLYLNSWNYNSCLILDELKAIVESNGGRVEKQYTVIISNRSITEALNEYKIKLERLNKLESNEKRLKAIETLKQEYLNLASIDNTPVKVNNHGYISFILGHMYYYYEMNDNPFFEFYFKKTPVINNQITKDCYLIEDKKEWLYDCFFKWGCSKEDIKEAANLIFNMLIKSDCSKKYRDGKKRRVSNVYNNGYHYEMVYKLERFETIDF